MIVLTKDNIARMQEADPMEINWWEFPWSMQRPATIAISYATEERMAQMQQLARQGKTAEAIKIAVGGWKYRPEMGDHDLGPEIL